MRETRPLRVMWRGLETELSYGSPRQSSTLPGIAFAEDHADGQTVEHLSRFPGG